MPGLKRRSDEFIRRHTGKLLNRLERVFLENIAKLLRDRINRLAKMDLVPGIVVPGQAEHDAEVYTLCESAWAWGAYHASQEMADKLRRRRRGIEVFGDYPVPESGGPVPQEAVEWAKRRTVLQGNWQRLLDGAVNSVIVQGLETGATTRQVMDHLRMVLPDFAKHRLETIARTESTSAYTAGRLATFRKSEFVVAVQFSAIIDGRTTRICRKRDGLILKMDDDRLAANTPPLHYNCRSTLVPVDSFDFEDLQNGDKSVEGSFFSWTDDSGPKTLSQALSGWDAAPPAMTGFGAIGG